MNQADFQTRSVRMARQFVMTVGCPSEDVERIVKAVVSVTPLVQGPYDGNAFVSAAGTERYRPREGAAAGCESAVRHRPGVVTITLELPHDEALLERVIETVFQVHSYQEPVIRVHEAWVARSRGLDDSGNPHRWWNTSGDWKG